MSYFKLRFEGCLAFILVDYWFDFTVLNIRPIKLEKFSALGLLGCGLIGTSVLGIGTAWLIGILGELVLSIGLLLFGLTNLHERLLPTFNGLPLLILVIYVPSWMVDPGTLPVFFLRDITEWLAVLVGVGWMLFGILLLLDLRE